MISLPPVVDSSAGQYQIDALGGPGVGVGEDVSDAPPLPAAPLVWNQQPAEADSTCEVMEQVNLERY